MLFRIGSETLDEIVLTSIYRVLIIEIRQYSFAEILDKLYFIWTSAMRI